MSMNATRFEKLLEAVPDSLVGMDQEGVILFVNRQTESLFGYDRDQLIGEPVDTLVPETRQKISVDHKEDSFADRRTRSSGLDLELRGRQRDGVELPIHVSLSHIDTGDVLLVITEAGGVALRGQAVKKAGLAAALVEYSADAVISTTMEGAITSWNPAAETMYGYSSTEAIGRSLSLLVPQDRAGETAAVQAKIQAGEPVEHLETIRVRKDGTVVPVSLTVSPICDSDGALAGACAVHRDVTEQRKAFEDAQHMASIVEGSDDAIFASTLKGVITSWNPAAERMFGYSSEEMIGQSGRPLSPRNRTDEIKTILDKVGAGQHIDHLETIRVRKDGTEFPVSLTVSPICDSDGTVVGASPIHQDVTEHKRAFEVAQRMEAIVQSSDDAIIAITL
jgi:PAS domain S-box-containing protein